MAGASGHVGGPNKPRELDHTSTWAVSAVCGIIILISIVLEKVLHRVGQWFEERRKKALYEALEKIKTELMILGFISLLLSFGQNYIASICIPQHIAKTMWFCPPRDHDYVAHKEGDTSHHRRLVWSKRRVLAGHGPSQGCVKGYAPLISANALHQLHIFIFFLAVFHVIYSAITMMLGRAKIRAWKEWEKEAMNEHEILNDPARFRLTHETSFVKEHSSPLMKTAFFFYIVCFFRQFFRSVRKYDYLTMRHGFISVHLTPTMKFNFQKYIKRSLEDDFKVVVGISPSLWAFMTMFILLDVTGWYYTAVITMIPPAVTLAVGTKLQAIISQMAIEIQERHAVIQGMPLVQVSDRHFWFSRPHFILHLIHFVLFQNAFEITYFFWIWYEFGLRSCFHHDFNLVIIRVCLGVGVQIMCSYITLPLYALVTQMGSTMKRSIFDEQTSRALMQWHRKAKEKNETRSEAGSGNFVRSKTLGSSSTRTTTSPRYRSKSTTDVEEGTLQDVNLDDQAASTKAAAAAIDDGDHHRSHGF